jgi:hypothetical protein
MRKRGGLNGFKSSGFFFMNPIEIVPQDSTILVGHDSHQIPANYLENPPPETLSSLDEQLFKVILAF